MTLFSKKPRPQFHFYLSLFGIVECFCTICFFTHFLHTKKASILSELALFYLYTFSRFVFFFQQVLHAFQADVQG